MTKEQLTAWIVANLTLSRTDLKFFSFVAGKAAAQQPITTAQNDLWHRLLRKYYRQLRKTFADDKIQQAELLEWAQAPVQTVRFNKLGIVDINGTAYLSLKTPYNKTINARIQTGLLNHSLGYNNTHGWYFLFSHAAAGDLIRFAHSVLGRKNYVVDPMLAEYISSVEQLGTWRQWLPTVRAINGRAMVSMLTEPMLSHLPEPTDWSIHAIKRYTDLNITLHPPLRRQLRVKYGRDLVELTCRRQPVLSVRAASLNRVCDSIYNYAVAHRLRCVAICTGSLYEDTVLDSEYLSLSSRLEASGIQVLVGINSVKDLAPDLILVATLMHVAHYSPVYPDAKMIVVSTATVSTRFINS